MRIGIGGTMAKFKLGEVGDTKICGRCGSTQFIGIEYYLLDPNHYDGVSEWQCQSCQTRYGRWTKKELKSGDTEPPYGKKRK